MTIDTGHLNIQLVHHLGTRPSVQPPRQSKLAFTSTRLVTLSVYKVSIDELALIVRIVTSLGFYCPSKKLQQLPIQYQFNIRPPFVAMFVISFWMPTWIPIIIFS
jgi:hypothetical protein